MSAQVTSPTKPWRAASSDLRHRVVARDLLEPAGQQRLRRVGGGEEDGHEDARLHQRRRRLGAEVQRERDAPAGRDARRTRPPPRSPRQQAVRRPASAPRARSRPIEQQRQRHQRAQACREHGPASSTGPRGGRDEQAVEPALLDVAREVHARRRAGERRPPGAALTGIEERHEARPS